MILREIRAERARREREAERRRIEERLEQTREECLRLSGFIRNGWHVLEPAQPYVDGWVLDAISEHLEAVTWGQITRLLINVPPGCMKSLQTCVFWPMWEWGPLGMSHMRILGSSYSEPYALRDTGRSRALLKSDWYQAHWPISLIKEGEKKFENERHGWREGVPFSRLTGGRGDRVIIDDPHSTEMAESDAERRRTTRIFLESVPSRLNNPDRSAIVVIMQRLHEDDISGVILSKELGYEHLMLPMEYDPARHCTTSIGFTDPRKKEGELLFPERFSREVVERDKIPMGSYAVAGQFQQSPEPRGGGIFKRDYWESWPPDDWNEDEIPTAGGKVLFPPMEFVLCQVDTAYTEDEQNSASACTTWGIWRDRTGVARVMLMGAWEDWLQFHDLVEKVVGTARSRKADLIRIEAKANGISVAQEIKRLCRGEEFGVAAVPVKGDKVSRAHSVQHLWEAGLIYAPDRVWAEKVIDQMAKFPKSKRNDLTDTATGAVKFLRDSSMLQLVAEHQDEMRRKLAPPGEEKPLYDV